MIIATRMGAWRRARASGPPAVKSSARACCASEMVRSADVSFLVIGFATAGLAAAWLWADAMTRITHAVTLSLYTLMRAAAVAARDARTV